MASTFYVVADKYVTLASEDFRNEVSQVAPDLYLAFRILVDYYTAALAHFDECFTSFDGFMGEMDMPVPPGAMPLWQQAYQNLRLDNPVARNALPPDVFVAAARNWFGLINGMEPRGCGDHAPVFRFQIYDRNRVNLLPYNAAFENRVLRNRNDSDE
eukprot:TRINITY_DN7020_c0_g1_i1.p1 TRINITY_DN7020_c0_g1~~TRINITY_DN7020_c0_g1_i1.p1  ORF type:complete len:178 (+),score=31.06 TRINITY_DN7020_c0_g1_i1:65-535(+)